MLTSGLLNILVVSPLTVLQPENTFPKRWHPEVSTPSHLRSAGSQGNAFTCLCLESAPQLLQLQVRLAGTGLRHSKQCSAQIKLYELLLKVITTLCKPLVSQCFASPFTVRLLPEPWQIFYLPLLVQASSFYTHTVTPAALDYTKPSLSSQTVATPPGYISNTDLKSILSTLHASYCQGYQIG